MSGRLRGIQNRYRLAWSVIRVECQFPVSPLPHEYCSHACVLPLSALPGDKERKIVVGTRFGSGADGMPIKLQWFHRSQPVGYEARIELNAGDMYVFSEKAVGYDWARPSIFTLRHAAGGEGYKAAATKQSGQLRVQVFRP